MKNQKLKIKKNNIKVLEKGDLSGIDMLRILNKLSPEELHSCDLICEL